MLIFVHIASSTANDNRLKEALLEFGQGKDLLVAILHPFGRQYQFVIVIVQALDDGNAASFKALNGLENAQEVGIQLLAIWRQHTRKVAKVQ